MFIPNSRFRKIKDEIKCKIEEEILTFRIEFFNV